MCRKKITILLISSCCLVAAATSAPAENLYRAYERMLSESRTFQTQFSERAESICRKIKGDCEKSALQGREVSLNSAVPLYSRAGYRIDRTGTLPAHAPFSLQGPLKGYFKIITLDQKKYLIAKNDFNAHYSSPCQAAYERCLAGGK